MWRKIIITLFVGLLFSSLATAGTGENLNASQAREMLSQPENKPFLLDVRTPQEYFEVRLSGATLIPIDQVVSRIAEIPKDRPLIVYCAVGSRSSQVTSYLARNGYGPVYNLYGGIWGWQLRGFPVEKGAP